MSEHRDTAARDRAPAADRAWFLARHPNAAEGVVRKFVARTLALYPPPERPLEDHALEACRVRANGEVWIAEE